MASLTPFQSVYAAAAGTAVLFVTVQHLGSSEDAWKTPFSWHPPLMMLAFVFGMPVAVLSMASRHNAKGKDR